MSGSPEELLRSALEKIVFFECRVANLESETEALRGAAMRARDEAGAGRRREAELEAALAEARGAHSVAAAQATELGERVRLLEAERARFLDGMVEQARVAGAPAEDGGEEGSETELAGFIAELRAEIVSLEAWRRAAQAAGVSPDAPAPPAQPTAAPAPAAAATPPAPQLPPPAPAPKALPAVASQWREAGRIQVDPREVRALQPAFATRSERALYESSLDDLASRDPGARRRAADCLKALGSSTAAPLLAAALGREEEAEVKSAILAALAKLAEPSVAALAIRELEDPRPAVRAAALEAANALAEDRALPQLAGALGDASPLVRRRAAVLLGFTPGDAAEDALASALADRDDGVARAAAAALAGRPSARAQGALARALDHRSPEVRRAAARAVVRWSGEAIDAAEAEPDRRRTARRMAEKLLHLDSTSLRAAVTQVHLAAEVARPTAPEAAAAPTPSPVEAAPALAPPPAAAPPERPARDDARPPPGGGGAGQRGAPRGARKVGPTAHVARATLAPDPALADAALLEVQSALRGRTAGELAETLDRPATDVELLLRSLVAEGRLVARGPRFFTA